MENPHKPETNGYNPINANPENELNLLTDGKVPTGETKST